MELYLIRHGIAADRHDAIADRDRPLTTTGIERTQAVAQRLAALGWSVSSLHSSPLVRARQTADILVAAGRCDRVKIDPHLAPDGQLGPWLDTLPRRNAIGPMALVGHEPNLSEWAAQLLGNATKATIVLKKAGIIGLALPEEGSPISRSQLFWLTPPRLFL